MNKYLKVSLSLLSILILASCGRRDIVESSQSDDSSLVSSSVESFIDPFSSDESSSSEENSTESIESTESSNSESSESEESIESTESLESGEESSEEESSSSSELESSEEESSEESSVEESSIGYTEPNDDVTGVDVDDLSELYNYFSSDHSNYSLEQHSYFNYNGAYDYYRHYAKNYVMDKISLYTDRSTYSYPLDDRYLGVMNTGYLNKDDNLYSYSLSGDDIDTRLSSSLTNSDLTSVSENKSYQDNVFTLSDLNEAYFTSHDFVRVGEHKYMSENKNACSDFIDLTAYGLINEGYYMTFSKVTIEFTGDTVYPLRIRLYASSTQIGKLLDQYRQEKDYPNWYLLFSESYVYDLGNTSINPISNL